VADFRQQTALSVLKSNDEPQSTSIQSHSFITTREVLNFTWQYLVGSQKETASD